MKKQQIGYCLLATLLTTAATGVIAAETESAPAKTVHGEYKDWLTLSVSHRLDKHIVRTILGNDIAIKAARAGKIVPWPDGTVIAKVGWKERTHPNWPQAVVPGELSSAEAMVKDSKKYAETGGWGFGHWEGAKLVMNDKETSATCFACHGPMKDHDYVFTFPVLQ